MSDAELVSALQDIFDAETPPDGIDRSDGFGEDYRIESLRIVPSDDGFDDLEVTVRFPRRVLPHRRTVVARLLFDREWREASDLDDAVSCAAYVMARWQSSVIAARSSTSARNRAAAEAWVPDAGESWQTLLTPLRAERGDVTEQDGGIVVPDDDGGTVTVHVTPEQWRSYVVESEAYARGDSGEDSLRPGDGPTEAYSQLAELIDSRWDDEHHVVFFRGGLHQSIRPGLPPVRSMMLRDPALSSEGGWYANAPEEDDGPT
jgi:hypothetical protein